MRFLGWAASLPPRRFSRDAPGKIPTFIHESNAIPGKANRFNGRLATRVLLGFGECAKYFPPGHSEVTGTPVRKTLVRIDQTEALAEFGLQPGRQTLLVMGGSQGAHGINLALITALPQLATHPLQCIHLTGAQDEALVRERYVAAGVPAFVAAFSQKMGAALSAADLCIARSGAASLTELAHFGLPGVLIPYPFAAGDHQTANARIFVAAGAAALLQERDVSSTTLTEKILGFLTDTERRNSASAAASGLAVPDAAERVANLLLQSCV